MNFYKKFTIISGILLCIFNGMQAQTQIDIKTIMQGEDFVGNLPDNFIWSDNSAHLYFNWKQEGDPSNRNLYRYALQEQKTELLADLLPAITNNASYNPDRTEKVFVHNGDIYLYLINSDKLLRPIQTDETESNAVFSANGKKVLFQQNLNLFSWQRDNGFVEQITFFTKGSAPTDKSDDTHKEWLFNQQIQLFEVLEDEQQQMSVDLYELSRKQDKPKYIYLDNAGIFNLILSPDERYVSYVRYKQATQKNTEVPDFVTTSGYVESIKARAKVGEKQTNYEFWIYDRETQDNYQLDYKKIPGVRDWPAPYPQSDKMRQLQFGQLRWSPDGAHAFLDIRSQDNKDRWLVLVDLATGEPELLDRQTDEAWIGGPGIGGYYPNGNTGWLPDSKSVWFQSEESGYSHLYTLDIKKKKKKALTTGKFEVYDPIISKDEKHWYFTANMEHSGVRHFYRMELSGKNQEQITSGQGRGDVVLSPDEAYLAIRYSEAAQPWELYIQENRAGAKPQRITRSLTDEFLDYPWRTPEFVTFEARDGEQVAARLFGRENAPDAPAVIFVHGAGYLQNAHKWWSSYYREYMFHNFLVDNGYVVLDIDYRGSAGYGRDWRTGIYTHMGGKDLSDHVDGADFLVETMGVDKNRIGIYGGSYGGFITLMALFKYPGVFRCGAALRSVTDWAHYNHGYTANILNTPQVDSLAYVRSSPIYFANGLEDNLLMLHGMIDDNVHFQDVVRLSQRLIELDKENWELAVFPVEKHAFKESSSWTNEYKRIFKLFEENLK